MIAMAEPLFTQDYCTLVPYQAGGALVAGRKQGCSLVVMDVHPGEARSRP
jgi:hypothetical protein